MASKCYECQYSEYPPFWGAARERIAAGVIAAVGLVIGIGLLLYARTRRSRLFAARSSWAIYLCVLNVVVISTIAVRELVGESRWPCVAQGLIDCLTLTMLPACIVIRIIGTLAQHLRQSRVLLEAHTRGSNHGTLSAATTRVAVVCGAAWFDKLLLHHKLYSSRAQALVALLCGAPWVLFYAVKLWVYPEFRTLTAVGCRNEAPQFIASGVYTAALIALLLPVYVRLALTPDALYLRHEVVCELVIVPPLVVWFLVAKLTPGFEVNVLTGNYAVLAYATVVFVVSVWLPSLASFLPSGQGASSSLLVRLEENPVGLDHSEGPSTAADVGPLALEAVSLGEEPSMHGALHPSVLALVPGLNENISLVDAVRIIGTSRVVVPSASLSEAVRVLQRQGRTLASSSRALRIVTAVLLTVPSGRALLLDALAREFCAEVVAFLVQAAAVRAVADAYMSELAMAFVDLGHVTRTDSVSTQSGMTAPPATPRAMSVQAPSEHDDAAAGALPGQLEHIDSLPIASVYGRPSGQHLEGGIHASGPAQTDAFSERYCAVVEVAASFLRAFIEQGAVAEVNISAVRASELRRAVAALIACPHQATASAVQSARAVSDDVDSQRVAAVSAFLSALAAAERDLFFVLVSGPVFRLVLRPEYAQWKAAILDHHATAVVTSQWIR